MKYYALICLLFLTACASNQGLPYQEYLVEKKIPLSDKSLVYHCHGYGCRIITPVPLSPADWARIEHIFKKPSSTAQIERKRISESIGVFEKIVGPKDGTDQDAGRTFGHSGDGQLDCVDESTNTTSFLSVMEKAGLFKFHTVEFPASRIPFINSGAWPHQTAVIRDLQTDRRFAVDSWFREAGQPADLVDLDQWRAGWQPVDLRGIN